MRHARRNLDRRQQLLVLKQRLARNDALDLLVVVVPAVADAQQLIERPVFNRDGSYRRRKCGPRGYPTLRFPWQGSASSAAYMGRRSCPRARCSRVVGQPALRRNCSSVTGNLYSYGFARNLSMKFMASTRVKNSTSYRLPFLKCGATASAAESSR